MSGMQRTVGRVVRLVILAALVTAPATAGAAAFPFADLNNNGVFDGNDHSIVDDLKEGYFETSESIVLPANGTGYHFQNGLSLVAGKHITIGAYVSTGDGGDITLLTWEGDVTILPKKELSAKDVIYISAGKDLIIGRESFVGTRSNGGMLMLMADGGRLIVERGASLRGLGGIELDGEYVEIQRGAQLAGGRSWIGLTSNSDAIVQGAHLTGETVHVYAAGHVVEFRNNVVVAPKKGGSVTLYAAGSTVDVTGSKFKNVSEDDIVIEAEEVVR